MMCFTVRVELHYGEGYYDALHTQMQARGFSRLIKASDGRLFHMPWGEYNYEGQATAQGVFEAANAAVRAIGKAADILVTQSNDRFFLLRAA